MKISFHPIIWPESYHDAFPAKTLTLFDEISLDSGLRMW